MRNILVFIKINSKTFIGILLGVILGFLYWYYFGCYWGAYPLSAECWVNCAYGAIAGGFAVTIFSNDI